MKKKEAMKEIFGKNKQRVSLTTDIWVCQHTAASYMVITAHYVDDMWQLQKFIIGFKSVVDHKGSTIAKVLMDCLAEWEIERVFCITVDNATANSSAMKKFKDEFSEAEDAFVQKGKFLHLRCATHILNLIVREGLQEIDVNISAIRNGVQFVRSSTVRLKAFENHVESRKIQRGSLPLDVKTRWNSTYLMLEQALKFRLAFDRMGEEDKPYNDYFNESIDGKKRIGPPVKTDWEAVDRLVQFLIVFYKATLALSASTRVCSHKLFHAIVTVTRNISALSSCPGPDETLRSKAITMLTKLGKYWDPFGDKVEFNRMIIVAGVFDPSKKMRFAEKCFEKLWGKGSQESSVLSESILEILRSLYEEYRSKTVAAEGANSHSQAASSHSQSQSQELVYDEVSQRTVLGNGLAYESMNDIYNELVQETETPETENELDLYMKESVVIPSVLEGSEFDVLSWWKFNSPRYPVLSQIAKDVLAMQVSSVASESAFSTSGRVLEPSRSCLTPYMIEVLMCTEQWLKCEIKLSDRVLIRKEELLAEVEYHDDLMREFEPDFNNQGH